MELIKEGRLPISPTNITFIPYSSTQTAQSIILEHSTDSDLTVVGFNPNQFELGEEMFVNYGDMGNILFVNTFKKKAIE